MTGPGSCVGLTRRQWLRLSLWLSLIGLLVLVAWCGDRVEAQDLALSDFDDTNVETDVLALMTKGVGGDSIYRSSASPPATGSLLSGELGLGDGDVAICRIRVQEQGATLRIHDCDPFSLSTYFGAGGAGSDLTLRVQTSAGTGTGTIDTTRLGASFAAFDLDANGREVLNGLPVGTNYIIALVRDLPVDPTQVTGVAATADDHDSITVTWSAATDADGYVVQWDTDSAFGSPSDATISSGSTVTYQITGLQEDTTYYVRVYATQTGADDGTPSSARDATTTLQPPGQVSGVSLTVDSDTELTVSWTAALRADGYRVEWGTTSGTYTGSAATTATSYTVTGLTYSTAYYVRVVATRTGADDGTPSDEESDTTLAPPTPGQVTGVDATADDHDSITVTWSATTDADGYVVQWDTDSAFGSPSEATISSGSTVTYRITGLQADTTYHVRVYATRTGASDGTPSTADDATTEVVAPAGQVTGVGATADDHDSITVTWNAVTDADGYVVQWDTDSSFGSPAEATISSGSTVTYRITGLQEDTTYHVRVYATQTGVEDGAPSSARDATTTLQPPGPVSGVGLTVDSDVAITVSWTAALRAAGYRVEWGTTSGTYTASAATTATSYAITGLTYSTAYYVRVVATRTGAADGAPSSEEDATTEAAPTLGQPTGLAVTALSDREMQATWTAAANATGYVVQWDADDTFPDPDEARVSGPGVIIERLMAETEYHVRVKGTRAGAADGAYSTSASATTGDQQTRVWAERFPGGPIAGQLVLSVFGGVMAGVRFKSLKSPRREAVITGAMSLGALILPAFGLANEFWVIGVALLVLLASIAAIFLARR